jgi:neutral ceramidase
VPEDRFQEALDFVKSDAPDGWDKWWAREVVLLHEANKVEPEVTAELQALQVGPVVFLSNGGEYFCQFGLNIKERSPFPFTYVVELANGCIGYVPTAEAMGPQGGGYEPRMAMSSRLVPEAGQMIEDASVELAQSLTPGEAPEPPQVAQAATAWDAGASKATDV